MTAVILNFSPLLTFAVSDGFSDIIIYPVNVELQGFLLVSPAGFESAIF